MKIVNSSPLEARLVFGPSEEERSEYFLAMEAVSDILRNPVDVSGSFSELDKVLPGYKKERVTLGKLSRTARGGAAATAKKYLDEQTAGVYRIATLMPEEVQSLARRWWTQSYDGLISDVTKHIKFGSSGVGNIRDARSAAVFRSVKSGAYQGSIEAALTAVLRTFPDDRPFRKVTMDEAIESAQSSSGSDLAKLFAAESWFSGPYNTARADCPSDAITMADGLFLFHRKHVQPFISTPELDIPMNQLAAMRNRASRYGSFTQRQRSAVFAIRDAYRDVLVAEGKRNASLIPKIVASATA